ncbi:uncharacterized protein LOC135113783 [Scylla paramamosain]|uniref:uncharacterized protein LOC135113783 n=1 Tax=Scylla paramamosain TaxID=85552 RepID=UPI003083AB6D
MMPPTWCRSRAISHRRPTFAQERCPQRPTDQHSTSLSQDATCHLKMHNVALQHTTPQAGDSRAPLDREWCVCWQGWCCEAGGTGADQSSAEQHTTAAAAAAAGALCEGRHSMLRQGSSCGGVDSCTTDTTTTAQCC